MIEDHYFGGAGNAGHQIFNFRVIDAFNLFFVEEILHLRGAVHEGEAFAVHIELIGDRAHIMRRDFALLDRAFSFVAGTPGRIGDGHRHLTVIDGKGRAGDDAFQICCIKHWITLIVFKKPGWKYYKRDRYKLHVII